MTDVLLPRPGKQARGRPFEKGRSGHPGGRRAGSRNKKTLAAAALLEGESEALTRRGRRAGAGRRSDGAAALHRTHPAALPPCRERAVKFELPPIESAADIAPAMKAVTSTLAAGAITPGEAATIAAVVDTFVRAIETSDFERRLKIVEAGLPEYPGGVPEMFYAGLGR